MSGKSGWCRANQHEGRVLQFGSNCPRVMPANGRVCECDCHKPKKSRFKSRKKSQ